MSSNSSTALHALIQAIPFGTRSIILVCCLVQALDWTLNLNEALVICSDQVLKGQLWRLVTPVFAHAGVLHILMNMMTLHSIAPHIEHKLGTLPFISAILLFAVLANSLYVALDLLARHLRFNGYCSVGFSGVLFSLVVLQTKISAHSHQNLFGFFSVPSHLYPWALLFLLQLIFPGISFLGHLSGLLVGFIYVSGALQWLSPSRAWISQFESRYLPLLTVRSSYVQCPAESLISPMRCGECSCTCWDQLRTRITSATSSSSSSSGGRFPGTGYRLGGGVANTLEEAHDTNTLLV
jgi:rhomboid domain-containing protein 1